MTDQAVEPVNVTVVVPGVTIGPAVMLLSSLGSTAGHVVFAVKNFDTKKHPHGKGGLFIHTFHEDAPKHAVDLQSGDVFATKTGKVFKVEKKTDNGVKVNPVDWETGEVKTGYTVLAHHQAVNVIEKAHSVGSQHAVSDLAPGTFIKTSAGKRFKVTKHGKWSTVYPVDDSGNVTGKHTVLPPQTKVTIEAPSIGADVDHDMHEHIHNVVTNAPKPHPLPHEPGFTTSTPTVVSPLDKLVDDIFAQPTKLDDPYTDPDVVDEQVAAKYKALQEKIHGVYDQISHNTLDAALGSTLLKTFNQGEGYKHWEGAFDSNLVHQHGVPEDALPDHTPMSHEWLHWTEAMKEHPSTNDPGVAQPFALPPIVQSDPALIQQPVQFTKAHIVDELAPGLFNVVFGPHGEEVSDDTFAHTMTDIKDAIGDGLDNEMGLPGNWQTAAEQITSALADYGIIYDGDLAHTEKVHEFLKDNWDAAVGTVTAPVEKHPAKVVQEILPTKLPKVPAAYAPGVGQHTKVVVRDTGGVHHVVRVSDAGEEFLGKANTKTAAYRIARTLSADHEAIEHESLMTSQNREVWNDAQHFGYADYGLAADGRIYQITGVEKHSVTGHDIIRGVGLNKDGEALDQIPGVIYASLLRVSDAHVAQAKAEHQDSHLLRLQHTEAIKLFQDAGFYKLHKHQVIRAERANKYNKHLQHDWNPDALVGADVNTALKTLTTLGYREIKPRQKDVVRVINAHGSRLLMTRSGNTITGVEAPKVANLNIDGSAKDFHGQLAETLASGGDITHLNPANGPPATQTSHTRQLLYDMAVGKTKGVEAAIGKGGKVKSDDAYRQEIEEGGAIPPLSTYIDKVDKPPIQIAVGGNALERLGDSLKNDPNFTADGPAGYYAVHENLAADQILALKLLLQRASVADHIVGEKGPTGMHQTILLPELQGKSPIEAAKILGDAGVKSHLAQPSILDNTDEATRNFLRDKINNPAALAEAQSTIKARQDASEGAAKALQTAEIQDLIDQRRAAEGTIKESNAEFDLPLWGDVQFKPQTYADINQLVGNIGTVKHDVPAFYTGGLVQDGVLYHQAQHTFATIPLEHDGAMVTRLKQRGAIEGANSDPLDSGYQGTAKLYAGYQLTYNVPGQGPQAFLEKGDVIKGPGGTTMHVTEYNAVTGDAQIQVHTAYGAAAGEPALWPADNLKQYMKQVTSDGTPFVKRASGPPKRIEYVMHDQASWNQGGAPTNQRGQLRMYGFTPEEAADALKELGVVGDLEPEVPFESVMRSPRRYGSIAPLLGDYVRGDAPLPTSKARVAHGVVGGAMADILQSGGLLSIAERHRHGIKVMSSSPQGDIRSGIADKIFCTIGAGGSCGGSASVKILMKPQVFLRRDITMSPKDFGAADSRYDAYKSYLNGLQSQVGVKKTNLYAPVDPKVRQQHLNTLSVGNGNEWNVGPMIPIEDWDTIACQTLQDVDTVSHHLDLLLASGAIATKPKVVQGNAATEILTPVGKT